LLLSFALDVFSTLPSTSLISLLLFQTTRLSRRFLVALSAFAVEAVEFLFAYAV
jgi:hypothetical protein